MTTVVVLNGFAVSGYVPPAVADAVLSVHPQAVFALIGDKVEVMFRYPLVRRFSSPAEMVLSLEDARFVFTPGDLDAPT